MSWGLCRACGYDKVGIANGGVCKPCAERNLSPQRAAAPAVAAALDELDRRSQEWAANEEERYWRAYMEQRIRGQRPDPPRTMSWQQAMSELRRRYVPGG